MVLVLTTVVLFVVRNDHTVHVGGCSADMVMEESVVRTTT